MNLKDLILSHSKEKIIDAIISRYYSSSMEERRGESNIELLHILFPFYYKLRRKIMKKVIINKAIKRYSETIDDIKNVKINPNGEEWIILAYEWKSEEDSDPWELVVSLYKKDDISKFVRDVDVESIRNVDDLTIDEALAYSDMIVLPQRFSYMMDHWSNILGFNVDIEGFEKFGLYDCIAASIYEMTFFGHSNLEVEKRLKNMLDERTAEEERMKKSTPKTVVVESVKDMLEYDYSESENIQFQIENSKDKLYIEEMRRKNAKNGLKCLLEEYYAILNYGLRGGLIA